MPNKPVDIRSYKFSPSDSLFLDANIWLRVYGPNPPADPKVRTYSAALSSMCAAGSKLFTDVLVISEFINSYARIEFNAVESKSHAFGNFKAFRKSALFPGIAKTIAGDVRRIIKQVTRAESGFPGLDIEKLLNTFESGSIDFNDEVIASICRRDGMTLVTDDGDFATSGLSIITANHRLLNI